MNKAMRILVALAIVSLAGTARAQTVNWKYAQVGWASFDPDNGSKEDGWLLTAVGELGRAPIHIFGEYNDLGDNDIWQLGAGWHGLLGERADLFADGAFFDADVEDGYRIRFGVRWMVAERFELNGFLSWTDLDFTDNDSAAVNAVFDLTKRIGVGGGFEWGDKWNSARVFVRFNFGQRS